mmetsp:Transcript_3388/g.8008  ORF Transcript_3388/g.8008 Transcript_3388/m.8008 type:complete len:334 (-) Transcript_3388:76-1077(-)
MTGPWDSPEWTGASVQRCAACWRSQRHLPHPYSCGCGKRRHGDIHDASKEWATSALPIWRPEQLFQGWTAKQWREWVAEPDGSRWCENKRYEADRIVDWMVANWGLSFLRQGSGVLDVGGEPGFLAAALLVRGVPVTVIDPTWNITGKAHWSNDCSLAQRQSGAWFHAIAQEFDHSLIAGYAQLLHNASAIVSLYGDEATEPTLRFAVDSRKPCAVVPCNECEHFFPDYDKTYQGYCEALLQEAGWRGGQFELVHLDGVPFSRALLVQNPFGLSALRWQHQGGEFWAQPQLAAEAGEAQQQVRPHTSFMRASDWERLQQRQDCTSREACAAAP